MAEFTVDVKKGDVVFTCHTPEQLENFLVAGYTEVVAEPEKKPTKKSAK